MTRLSFSDNAYEAGASLGVLYPQKNPGISWNGLVSVVEQTDSETPDYVYLDGIKTYIGSKREVLSLSVEAFTYPPILDDIHQEIPGFSYQTVLNNRKLIHLIFNPFFVLDEKTNTTVTDSTDPANFVWNCYTRPEKLNELAPTSHLIIDISNTKSQFVQFVEDTLYGSAVKDAEFLPAQNWVSAFLEMETAETLLIVDHGDGSWTAVGSDSMVNLTAPTEFQINSPTAIFLDAESYQVSSF